MPDTASYSAFAHSIIITRALLVDWTSHPAPLSAALHFTVITLGVWMLCASATLFWRPVYPEAIEKSERALMDAFNIKAEWEWRLIAGHGTLVVPSADPSSQEPPVVLLHGYAAGAPFFGPLFDGLAARRRLFSLDWLGCGRSLRPRWTARGPVETEAHFVAALEAWRAAAGLDRFALVGHSTGAVMAAEYAMRYPGRVTRLVLVSPACVGPPDLAALAARRAAQPWPTRLLLRAAAALWEADVTPMSLVRLLGPLGPAAARAAVRRRAGRAPAGSLLRSHTALLAEYEYHNWAGDCSGELAVNGYMAPFGYARRPLLGRLTAAAVPAPLTLVYGGERDWMDAAAGEGLAAEVRAGGGRAAVRRVPAAGHQIMMDDPAGLLAAVLEALDS